MSSTERDEIRVEEQFEQYEEELEAKDEADSTNEEPLREPSGRAWLLGECKEEVEEVLRKHLRRLFQLLDPAKSGVLSELNIDISVLSHSELELLRPVFRYMEQSKRGVQFDVFFQLLKPFF